LPITILGGYAIYSIEISVLALKHYFVYFSVATGEAPSTLIIIIIFIGCLCDLVVRVPGHKSTDAGSISGATRFSEK
jgi:hypothetical protein